MIKPKSTFNKNLQIENEIAEWLHTYYYSTELFEKVEKINQSDLQHKGIDVYQTSYEIFKDRRAHAVDEKCAMTYVKNSHEEKPLQTFAFELNYMKDNKLKDGWLFGDKYSSTEYYQLMWLWADVPKKNNRRYNWEAINRDNITKIKGYLVKKTAIQKYLAGIGLTKEKLIEMRHRILKSGKNLQSKDKLVKIMISKQLEEKPMNIIINSKKIKELSIHHFEKDLKKIDSPKIYSKTRILAPNLTNSSLINDITKDIRMGIKNIIFSKNPKHLKEKIKRSFSERDQIYLEQSILFEVNDLPQKFLIKQNKEFCNGELDSNDWYNRIPSYNWDQYVIEHASFKNNISVKAGAGTGKTRTMVQRMLYLVIYKDLTFEEIGLVTFTNDAAKEMKERIEEVILARFQITRSTLYLNFLENMNQINISTIDSFSRTFIEEYDYKLGLGKKTPITSYVYRKKEIISSVINRSYKSEVRTLLKDNRLAHHELIEHIYNLWEKILSLGIEMKEFKDYDVLTERDALLKKIVIESNGELTVEKWKDGKIDLSDLKFLSKRVLKKLTKEDLGYSKLKYLFVDEFQDTDNIQIDYIRSIHEKLGTILFIVGDDKQSIYRFRGAEHTAFKRISKKIPFTNYNLNINYRTDGPLLLDMNKYFGQFKYLPPSEQLRPFLGGQNKKVEIVKYDRKDYDKDAKKYTQIFINRMNEEVDDMVEGSSLAILCRTNKEINIIANILDNHGYKGKYQSSKSGSLFQRTAAIDLAKFIKLLLTPVNSVAHLGALGTPYFYKNITPTEILRKLDNTNTILDSDDYDKLDELAEMQKTAPFLSILRKNIIGSDEKENTFNKNLYSRYIQNSLGEAEDYNLYRENYYDDLNFIIEKIGETFGHETYSAVDISKWLDTQINTNDTDELPIEQNKSQKIILTTIHKSKGLEYDSVIIPLTHHPIWMHREGFYVDYDEKFFVSNLKKEGEDPDYESVRYKETKELLKEESRVLYVAMTRAKKSLRIFKPQKVEKNSFAGLLEGKE